MYIYINIFELVLTNVVYCRLITQVENIIKTTTITAKQSM